MEKIIVETEKLRLETSNYVADKTNIILVGTISEATPLSYWLRISQKYEYDIEVTTKDVINLWIPLNDIISIRYEKD